MNILFVCSQNEWRSPTAEQVFKTVPGWKVMSAGTDGSARHSISKQDIKWADKIFVMEKNHQEILKEKFEDEVKNKEIVTLNIPDQYMYMDPELIELLKQEMKPYIEEAA